MGCAPCSAPHPHGLFFRAWLPGELLKGRLVWPCLPSPRQLWPHKAPSANRPEETVRGRSDTEHPRLGHSLRCAWHHSHPVPKLQTRLEVRPALPQPQHRAAAGLSLTRVDLGSCSLQDAEQWHQKHQQAHGEGWHVGGPAETRPGGVTPLLPTPRASVMLFRHPIPMPLLPKGPRAPHGASKSPPRGQHRPGWMGRPAGGGWKAARCTSSARGSAITLRSALSLPSGCGDVIAGNCPRLMPCLF